jgi:isopenicillin N synthase-like dioxygenase
VVSPSQLPVIDISTLVAGEPAASVAREIENTCRQQGFFYIVGHGVDMELQEELEHLSREFFYLDLEAKMAIRMELGGRAWRGYFPVGDEFTSGVPDAKEGIYFGSELPADHPKVAAQTPLHGCNLFPDVPGFRETLLDYLDAMTNLGHTLMRGVAQSLGLDSHYFRTNYTEDPTILFRIFHYPPAEHQACLESWGVGEHTDYGLLTVLRQDDQGGLQVKSESAWIEAPPIPNSFVCNIGDMLDRMSGGLYRSTPHRVKNRADRSRLSFPFFFDPDFDAVVKPIFSSQASPDRWDGTNLQELSGTYGEYLLNKISKVFPELSKKL